MRSRVTLGPRPHLDFFVAARQSPQPGQVADDHDISLNLRDVFARQPAQYAISMRTGETEMTTDLLLRQE